MSKLKKYITYIFVIIEIVIYFSFLIPQIIHGGEYLFLKYSGIILCLIYSLIMLYFCKEDALLLSLAFLFTAISDLFIFILNDYYEIGVLTFIITQLIYFIRINLIHGKKPYISLSVRFSLMLFIFIILIITNNLFLLTALVAIYFSLLVCNTFESIVLFKNAKHYILFFIGLLLFVCCDICVGLNNFALLGISLPSYVEKFIRIAMWGFYLPSQVLIALSAHKTKYRLFFKRSKNEE